ncbi:hypothetical protein FOZ63_020853, partial [Perkinsus olseni]
MLRSSSLEHYLPCFFVRTSKQSRTRFFARLASIECGYSSPVRVARPRTRAPRAAIATAPAPVLVVAKERKTELTTALQNGGIIVLFGPPGCGKHFLLRAVCEELGLSITEYRSRGWVRG